MLGDSTCGCKSVVLATSLKSVGFGDPNPDIWRLSDAKRSEKRSERHFREDAGRARFALRQRRTPTAK